MIVDQWDVVAVPFPFTDVQDTKIRPALALSQRDFNTFGHTILAMITSARHSRWPGDVLLDHQPAGLSHPSVARLKIFTLDNRFIRSRIGTIASKNIAQVCRELRQFVPF